mmetsp:Transcript_2340/g.8368  ORF Transcript_2340/g.8368 Transcript_2340/m.8368 type:complete len:219 (+) Transcript_2340:1102-1758(+)
MTCNPEQKSRNKCSRSFNDSMFVNHVCDIKFRSNGESRIIFDFEVMSYLTRQSCKPFLNATRFRFSTSFCSSFSALNFLDRNPLNKFLFSPFFLSALNRASLAANCVNCSNVPEVGILISSKSLLNAAFLSSSFSNVSTVSEFDCKGTYAWLCVCCGGGGPDADAGAFIASPFSSLFRVSPPPPFSLLVFSSFIRSHLSSVLVNSSGVSHCVFFVSLL